ncbi:MAG: hypothetical protein CO167_13830, partial [Candidatus Marinimicrobia bacterium CG_4_9_14_3_um_filter_48_9]
MYISLVGSLIISALADSAPVIRLTIYLPDTTEIRMDKSVFEIATFLDSLTGVFADSGYLDANWTI